MNPALLMSKFKVHDKVVQLLPGHSPSGAIDRVRVRNGVARYDIALDNGQFVFDIEESAIELESLYTARKHVNGKQTQSSAYSSPKYNIGDGVKIKHPYLLQTGTITKVYGSASPVEYDILLDSTLTTTRETETSLAPLGSNTFSTARDREDNIPVESFYSHSEDLKVSRKVAGLCQLCGEKGHFDPRTFHMICSTHGVYP